MEVIRLRSSDFRDGGWKKDGKLIITPDTMRAETESREKEFLDREMALLQKRFDAEKQKIRQQIVAEREAMYVAEGR